MDLEGRVTQSQAGGGTVTPGGQVSRLPGGIQACER